MRVRTVIAAVVLATLAVACSAESPPQASGGSTDIGGHMDARLSPSLSPSPSGTEGEEGEAEASPPAETIPPGTRVPDIRGMEFEDAVIALRTLGMDFGFVVARTSAADEWEVIEQWPKAGAQPPTGGKISMTVSMGPSGGGVAGPGGVQCKPEEDDIDEPYCMGKILRY